MTLDPRIDHEIAEYVGAEAEWPTFSTIEEEREYWTAYCVARNEPRPKDMEVSDSFIPGPGGDIPIRTYRPSGAMPGGGLIFFAHGGGYVSGNLDTNDTMCWRFAEAAGAILISVNYRHAPEHKYPAALEDFYAALVHVVDHASDLAIDPGRIVVCGDSAGANLSAGLCLLTRDRCGPIPKGQILIYPALGGYPDLPSYAENRGDPFLSFEAMAIYKEAYLGPTRKPSTVYGEPLKADDLSNLPACVAIGCEVDPVRDDASAYVARLQASGVEAQFQLAKAMPHSFLRLRKHSRKAAEEFEKIEKIITDMVG